MLIADILVGGLGNDRLFGGLGRNVLIGGSGSDWLFGFSDDLLISGLTLYDRDHTVLVAIRNEWVTKREVDIDGKSVALSL